MAAQDRAGGDSLIPACRDLLHNPSPQLPPSLNGRVLCILSHHQVLAQKQLLRVQAASRLLPIKAAAFDSAPSLLLLEATPGVPGVPAFQTDPQLADLAEHASKTDGSTSDATFHGDTQQQQQQQQMVARCSGGTFAVTFRPQVLTLARCWRQDAL